MFGWRFLVIDRHGGIIWFFMFRPYDAEVSLSLGCSQVFSFSEALGSMRLWLIFCFRFGQDEA